MAKNVVPEAKDALNRFKMEAASDVDVSGNLKKLSATKAIPFTLTLPLHQ